jgi:hypothetical protein
MKLMLSMVLLAPSLLALEPTPWDKMPAGWIGGDATVTTLAGKHVKLNSPIRFTPAALECNGCGHTVLRAEVKEIVIRDGRPLCSYDDFVLGMALGLADHGPAVLLAIPGTIVSLPAWLVYQGVGHILPVKTRYRVTP